MSYFYHVIGLKDYSDALRTAADEAENTLLNQHDVLVNAFNDFNDMVSGNSIPSGSIDNIMEAFDGVSDLGNSALEAVDLVRTIAADPKAELKLMVTVFARKLNYKITNELVSLMAEIV